MSKPDDLANAAPVQPPVNTGSALPGFGLNPPPDKPNAFTEVTIKQLYFFVWKWAVAAIMFALPFIILNILLAILSH